MYEVDTYCRSCVPGNVCLCVFVCVCVCLCVCLCLCVNCRANILLLLSVHVLFFDPKISVRLEFLKFSINILFFYYLLLRTAFTYYNTAVLSNWKDLEPSLYFLIDKGLPFDD